MKKRILFVFVLTAILVCTFLPACTGEGNGINWKDIPVYPRAELQITRNWTVLPAEEPWSDVEWRYYLAADKYSSGEVVSFYETEILAEGWQVISGLEQPGVEEMLWSYHKKINLYIPPNIVGRLGYWSYNTKNNESDWLAVWIGVNKEWELADKLYIVIMKAN